MPKMGISELISEDDIVDYAFVGDVADVTIKNYFSMLKNLLLFSIDIIDC